MYSVVIPTRRPTEKILPTLISISLQTYLPEKVFLIRDTEIKKEEFDDYKKYILEKLWSEFYKRIVFICHLNSSFKPGLWVSYVRNYGISLVNAPMVLAVDDDNVFDTDFCARLMTTRNRIHEKKKITPLLIPTEKYQGEIRSRWYRAFWYRAGVQRPRKLGVLSKFRISEIEWEKILPIKFASSNCLFGPRKIFEMHPFDERMGFVYEDMDMTKRVTNAWHKIYVLLDLFIDHQMRSKTPLNATYVGNPTDAYQKGRNRVMLVKNTGDIFDKLEYFVFGLRIHTAFLIQKICRHAKWSEKNLIIKALRKWTKDWILGRYDVTKYISKDN